MMTINFPFAPVHTRFHAAVSEGYGSDVCPRHAAGSLCELRLM